MLLTDIDECAAGWHQCPSTATCQNVVGQYLCHCGYGFYGDRKTCHRQLQSSSYCHLLLLLTPTLCVCMSACASVGMIKSKRLKLRSPNLSQGQSIVSPDYTFYIRSKDQRSTSQSHKVQKHISGDRVAGVSLHSIVWLTFSYYYYYIFTLWLKLKAKLKAKVMLKRLEVVLRGCMGENALNYCYQK